jgi:2-methylaconitate cis-trans-isomerase PrpF
VPGTSAEIQIDFLETAGSACGALLPTGNATDAIDIDGRRVHATRLDLSLMERRACRRDP